MDTKSAIVQFCDALSTVNEQQTDKPNPCDQQAVLTFDPRNDKELGDRLIKCLQENRLPFFRDALVQLRDFITVIEEMTDDEKQLHDEAAEVLEDTLSLLELVDFTVDNSKADIPSSVVQNIGRLFRRLSSNLYNLVTCWESLRKNCLLAKAEETIRKRERKQFWKMMKWVAVEAMIVTAGITLVCASPTMSSRLIPLLTNIHTALTTEAAAESVLLPMTLITSLLSRR